MKKIRKSLVAYLSCLILLMVNFIPMNASAANSYGFSSPFPGKNPLNYINWEYNGNDHFGMDMTWSGIAGTSISAVKAGTVVRSGWHDSWGYHVKIDHGNNLATLYAHMQTSPSVANGAKVSQGQVIGKVGSTGYSTGPHLHFEVYVNGTRVNPKPYLTNCDLQPGGGSGGSTTSPDYNDTSYKFQWSGSTRTSYTPYRAKGSNSRVYFKTQTSTLPMKGYYINSYLSKTNTKSAEYLINNYNGYAINSKAPSSQPGNVRLEARYPESHYSWGNVTITWSPDYRNDGSTLLG